MTHPTGSPVETVSALLAERTRYEGWLAALESRRSTTPPHIYDRVHADYHARLKYVREQLLSHQNTVRDAAATLSQRLVALEREEGGRRDELSEAEVRAAVGEIGPDQAQEIVRRNREAIAAFGAERAAVSAELGRLRDVLAGAGTTSTGGPSATPFAVASGSAGAAPPSAGHAAGQSSAEAQRWDVGTQRPATAGAPGTSAPASGKRPPGFDELEFLKSVVNPPGGGSAGTAPLPEASRAVPATVPFIEKTGHNSGAGATFSGPADEAPPAAPEPGEVPSFLKDVPPEQVKTLKCQECGTMNYPTEWYCERCGAELAAL